MVVETAFADPDCSIGDKGAKRFDITGCIKPDCIVRMNAGCEPHEAGVAHCDVPRCTSGAEDIPGAAPGADAYDGIGTTLLCSLDYRVAVAVERRVGEVRVGVDVPFDIPALLGHFLSIQSSVGLAM